MDTASDDKEIPTNAYPAPGAEAVLRRNVERKGPGKAPRKALQKAPRGVREDAHAPVVPVAADLAGNLANAKSALRTHCLRLYQKWRVGAVLGAGSYGAVFAFCAPAPDRRTPRRSQSPPRVSRHTTSRQLARASGRGSASRGSAPGGALTLLRPSRDHDWKHDASNDSARLADADCKDQYALKVSIVDARFGEHDHHLQTARNDVGLMHAMSILAPALVPRLVDTIRCRIGNERLFMILSEQAGPSLSQFLRQRENVLSRASLTALATLAMRCGAVGLVQADMHGGNIMRRGPRGWVVIDMGYAWLWNTPLAEHRFMAGDFTRFNLIIQLREDAAGEERRVFTHRHWDVLWKIEANAQSPLSPRDRSRLQVLKFTIFQCAYLLNLWQLTRYLLRDREVLLEPARSASSENKSNRTDIRSQASWPDLFDPLQLNANQRQDHDLLDMAMSWVLDIAWFGPPAITKDDYLISFATLTRRALHRWLPSAADRLEARIGDRRSRMDEEGEANDASEATDHVRLTIDIGLRMRSTFSTALARSLPWNLPADVEINDLHLVMTGRRLTPEAMHVEQSKRRVPNWPLSVGSERPAETQWAWSLVAVSTRSTDRGRPRRQIPVVPVVPTEEMAPSVVIDRIWDAAQPIATLRIRGDVGVAPYEIILDMPYHM